MQYFCTLSQSRLYCLSHDLISFIGFVFWSYLQWNIKSIFAATVDGGGFTQAFYSMAARVLQLSMGDGYRWLLKSAYSLL